MRGFEFLRSFRRPWSCRPARLLVGHLGVEPSATALSERPLRPAGSWPADGGGPGPQRVRALPGSSRRLPPGSFTIQVRKTEDPTPCGRPLTRLRIGDCLHGGFIFHGPPPMRASGRLRRMEIPTPSTLRRPSAFQAEPAPWPVHPPSEEGGRLERQGVTPASVSNGARRSCPVHLPFVRSFVPNRGFEPRTSWFWARRLYLGWASSACERLTGFEPATSTVARWRSCLLSYNRMEPSPGADPGGTPIPRASGRRSEGHRSGSWTRTKGRPLVGAGGKYARRDSNPQSHGPQPCPSTCLRHERKRAATRCRPGPSAVRRRSRSRARRQSYPPWIRTRNLLVQSQALLPFELEGME